MRAQASWYMSKKEIEKWREREVRCDCEEIIAHTKCKKETEI